MIKQLPTDLPLLREKLQNCKNKEIRLEADLAIKDFPDYENEIATVALTLFEYVKALQNTKSADRPGKDQQAQIKALSTQIKFYESKLQDAQTTLTNLFEKDKGRIGRYHKLQDRQHTWLVQVEAIIDELAPEFEKSGKIDLVNLFPRLREMFPEKKLNFNE